MAKKIRFPLKMKNGEEVRTLDELKENFDLESVLGYFKDGKLETWLADRYYDIEAAKIVELDPDSESFKVKLCEVLGVPYIENPNEETDLDYINRRNEKKAMLSQLTDDIELLNNIDSVALNQDDLFDCYDMELSTIYLVGDTVFSIPVSVTNITYIGCCGAKAEIRATSSVDFKEKNINFEGISFIGDIKPVIQNKSDDNCVNKSVDYNNIPECDGTNFKELLELAKGGNVSAQFEIGKFLYEYMDKSEGKEWLLKAINSNCYKAMLFLSLQAAGKYREYIITAANNGYAPAQYKLGLFYCYGEYGFTKDKDYARKWFKKAAENNHICAQIELADLLLPPYDNNYDEAIKWLTKAAEQGDTKACKEIDRIKRYKH